VSSAVDLELVKLRSISHRKRASSSRTATLQHYPGALVSVSKRIAPALAFMPFLTEELCTRSMPLWSESPAKSIGHTLSAGSRLRQRCGHVEAMNTLQNSSSPYAVCARAWCSGKEATPIHVHASIDRRAGRSNADMLARCAVSSVELVHEAPGQQRRATPASMSPLSTSVRSMSPPNASASKRSAK